MYSAGLFHHVLIYMGDLHLVIPALNLSSLDAGILIMVQQVRLMIFSLNMMDYSMSFLYHVILVSAPGPLGLIGSLNWVGLCWGSGTKGLGAGLGNINFGSHQVLSRIRVM